MAWQAGLTANGRRIDGSLIKTEVVEPTGFEPVTSSMPSRRAPNCATAPHYRRDIIYNTRARKRQTSTDADVFNR